MKKKFLLVFSLVLCIFLASCRGNNNSNATLVDNADSTVYEQLNLSVLEDAVSINEKLDKTIKNYIDVKLPKDLNSSLVVRHVNIDGVFNENRVKAINATALTFVTGISVEYQAAIMQELSNSEYGITKDKLGLSVDVLTGTSFSIKIDSAKALEYYNDNKTNITLSVIYLPVKVLIINDSKSVADITVLVPVYAEFNLGEASEVFSSYKVVEINLEEDGSLPNKK